MRLFDLTLPTLEANLALDEALLREGHETLRFWESPAYAVVLGASGRRAEEADLPACAAAGVPVLRRASGGGTVLIGPGCLMYALVLPFSRHPHLRDIPASYGAILRTFGIGELAPPSDLVAGDRKFAGCAQRRLRDGVLHHGTMLYDFDLARISQLLREPRRQPAHRQGRTHDQFLTNVALTEGAIKQQIAGAWSAERTDLPPPDVARLVADKYAARSWTERC